MPKRKKFVLQDKFESKGMCDMLGHCQGSRWKCLKEKGTSRKIPLDMMQKLLNMLENCFTLLLCNILKPSRPAAFHSSNCEPKAVPPGFPPQDEGTHIVPFHISGPLTKLCLASTLGFMSHFNSFCPVVPKQPFQLPSAVNWKEKYRSPC